MTSISIPNAVTSLGNSTFQGCSGLTSATLGTGIITIGILCFQNCTSLTSVSIPNATTTLSDNAFQECSALASLTLGTGIITMGISCFQSCTSLTSVSIPNSTTTLGSGAFLGCSGLTSATLGTGITTIGTTCFQNCTSLTTISIPNSTTSLGNSAFQGCSALASVTFGSGLTTIPQQCFRQCALTSITIPNTITSLGIGAFQLCTSLTAATLGTGIITMGNTCFQGCTALTAIFIPNSTTTLGNGVFNSCAALATVTGGVNITTMGISCFTATAITSFTIPSTLTVIPQSCFQNCTALTSIVIPANITTISASALRTCTTLSSVTLYYGLTTLGDAVFRDCPELTSLAIPGSVTTLGTDCFRGTTLLTTLIFYGQSALTSISTGTFTNNVNPIAVYYYQTADSSGLSSASLSLQSQYPVGTTYTYYDYKAMPTLGGFADVDKTYGDPPFTLTQPTTNSTGTFSYTSSDEDVATIAGAVVTLLSPGESVITADQAASPDFQTSSIPMTLTVDDPVCFPAGTPVDTDQGAISIEKIIPGEHTIRGKKIIRVVRTINPDSISVKIYPGAFGKNMPHSTTIISKHHGILLESPVFGGGSAGGVEDGLRLWRAHELPKHNRAVVFANIQSKSAFYNVLLEDHTVMIVNGLVVETLDPNHLLAKKYTREQKYVESSVISDARALLTGV